MHRFFALVLTAMLLSCKPDINNALDTGLQGTVIRGPITPVCTENTPCDAPFSALFFVLKDDREVSRFESDTQGGFNVALDPGLYTIIPDSSAPIMHPQQQRQEVEVQSESITHVTLYFDTGIR